MAIKTSIDTYISLIKKDIKSQALWFAILFMAVWLLVCAAQHFGTITIGQAFLLGLAGSLSNNLARHFEKMQAARSTIKKLKALKKERETDLSIN